jgi:hypothetical protein
MIGNGTTAAERGGNQGFNGKAEDDNTGPGMSFATRRKGDDVIATKLAKDIVSFRPPQVSAG